ncbi:MAG TPA: hypothetical protein VHU91_04220 [Mycobacteriales bacterium]|nr:hypothetical protein [Mycobacteriales bacterium]
MGTPGFAAEGGGLLRRGVRRAGIVIAAAGVTTANTFNFGLVAS